MDLGKLQGVVLLCGRYEGVDERLIARQVDEEISIGDYVLSGGELAAMVLIDGLVRQMPGVLGDPESANQDSFANGRKSLLDCPTTHGQNCIRECRARSSNVWQSREN